jgi:nucleoside-diphosphate-sugar epimerase
MKIAVTGTSGRIGRAIHFALCQEHDVVGIDRSVSSVTTHLGEIDNYQLLTKAFKGADAVISRAPQQCTATHPSIRTERPG